MVIVLDTLVVDKLIEVLDQEARIYDDILKISKDKTNVIIEGKVSELESIVKLEQSLVLCMGKLEDIREQLVEKLSGGLGLNSPEVTVSQIMKHMKNDQAEKLKSCQDRIIDVLGELKNTNDLNSRLIKNSLEYIDFSINLLSAADAANSTYGNTGQVNNSKKRSFIDMKL